MRQHMLVACVVVGGGIALGAAQESTHVPVSVVEDWSSRHVIFAEEVPRESRGAVLLEPRFWQQYYRRHATRSLSRGGEASQGERRTEPDTSDRPEKHKRALSHRDWSVSLGAGSGGQLSGPAKFVFDVTAAANCNNDFVVTGVSVAGAANQANIIGLNNLYTNTAGTGFCLGTGPNVIFAYNVGAGTVPSLVALSLDGLKIAFSENNAGAGTSNFHVLQFQRGAGNGTSATTPAVPGTGNTAVDTKIALVGNASGPFVDYAHDVAYVATAFIVHKFTGVFKGTPAEVTTGGWPATIPGNPVVSTPVYDGVSRHVFFTDGNGFIDYIDDSVSPAVIHSGTFSFAAAGITPVPVIVDSSRQKVYAFTGNPNGANAVAAQGDTNLTAASRVTVNIGPATGNAILEGDFTNAYYSGGTPVYLYVVGTTTAGAVRPALYRIGFNAAFRLNATTANGPRALSVGATTGVTASPLTEFYNSTFATDFLFVGTSAHCVTGNASGCIRSVNINGAFPTAVTINNVILNAAGGTGSITVDNNSGSAQASSVYYTTGTGNTIVKATQSALQ